MLVLIDIGNYKFPEISELTTLQRTQFLDCSSATCRVTHRDRLAS